MNSLPGVPPAATQSQTPPPEQATISIQDLQTLLAAIDIAAQRGAFRPAEFTQVGATFERLALFINSVVPQQQPAPAATPPQPQAAPLVPPPIMPQPGVVQMPTPVPPFAPKLEI